MKNQIIFEDNHLLIINKLPGQIVQGDKTGDIPLLDLVKNFIKIRDNKPGNVFLGLVHRIDRPTSGIVVFAKTSKALTRMTEKFKTREIQKTYLAIVPKSDIQQTGRLVHYLRKNEANNKAKVYPKPVEGAKEAILNYEILEQSDRYILLKIDLETGRHHQIRAQLATMGVPIKGDLKYGSPRSNLDGSICLHAYQIQFYHPTTEEKILVTAPLPTGEKIWSLFHLD